MRNPLVRGGGRQTARGAGGFNSQNQPKRILDAFGVISAKPHEFSAAPNSRNAPIVTLGARPELPPRANRHACRTRPELPPRANRHAWRTRPQLARAARAARAAECDRGAPQARRCPHPVAILLHNSVDFSCLPLRSTSFCPDPRRLRRALILCFLSIRGGHGRTTADFPDLKNSTLFRK